MNQEIAERFSQKNSTWDFTTVVGGKVVRSGDLEAFQKEAERVAEELEKKKLEEIKKTQVALPAEVFLNELGAMYPIPEAKEENEISFYGLEDFVLWYLSKREEFPEDHRQYLNVLVSVEALIHQGCECKKEERRGQAQVFFQRFFETNREAALFGIKTVGRFSKVKFFLKGDTSPFLEG
jgi:hypothetical protein